MNVQSIKFMSKAFLFICLSGLLLAPVHAIFFGYPSPPGLNNFSIYQGYVYARGLYYTPDDGNGNGGNLVYVVYDEEGVEIEEIGEIAAGSDFESSFLMSVTEYNQYIQHYEQQIESFESFYGEDAANKPELLTVEEYQRRLPELTVVSSDANTDWAGNPSTHELRSTTRSVLVLPETLLYTATTQYLLAQYPIDLTESQTKINPDYTSLIIGFGGDVLERKRDRIGYRSIFFEDTELSENDENRYNQTLYSYAQRRTEDDLVLTNPIRGLSISAAMPFRGDGISKENGHYGIFVTAPSCYRSYYSLPLYFEAKIPYRSFNPSRPGVNWYYLAKHNFYSCTGYEQTHTIQSYPSDFVLDVNMLNGGFYFPGVEQATELDDIKLEYDFSAPAVDPQTGATASRFTNTTFDSYDFDLDGSYDTAICGTLEDSVFIPAEDTSDCSTATVQGIYLSGYSNAPNSCTDIDGDGAINPEDPQCQPQFTRLIDTEAVTQHIGLVKKMATDHVQDTDLYIIRQANGQLVAMRQGLKDSEAAYQFGKNDIEASTDDVWASYRMLMRGPKSYLTRAYHQRYLASFDQWQQDSNMAPEFQQLREADHLRTGEVLEVWAINRVTGYIGHQTIVLGSNALSSGYLDTLVPTIAMYPPNLKIWAERSYTIESGLTKDEDRHYLIGNEGIGEADDTVIKITTQWLDQDGSALPAALSQYGYTGRLAYVSGSNQLTDASQAGHARFGIEPGTHTELIRLKSSNANQHYYVQVNAVPAEEFDDFALSDDGPQDRTNEATFEELERNHYRPERFVPFLTPQYNEELSEVQQQAYLIEKARRIAEEESLEDLTKPSALHDWYYRPDYQFSVYDLVVDEINTSYTDENNNETTTDLLTLDTPILNSTDDVLEYLFDLNGTSNSPLERLDGEQTLTLAIGEQETEVTISDNNTIAFTNFDHLASLNPDDYLTMRLYTNEDAGNIVWEYAFEYLYLDTQWAGYEPDEEGKLYVSADQPDIPLQALLVGYSGRDPERKEEKVVRWSTTGAATLEKSIDSNKTHGAFFNTLTMPTTAGSQTVVSLTLAENASADSEARLGVFEVLPGAPDDIQYYTDGEPVHIAGIGQRSYTFTIKDQHGNLVSDHTGVSFSTDGSLLVIENDDATLAGQASITLAGAEYAESASVTIKVGSVSRTVDLEVLPLSIELAAASDWFAGSSSMVTAKVTDSTGAPAQGITVNFASTYGYVSDPTVTTDNNGAARMVLTAPGSKGNGEISARVALGEVAQNTFTVSYEDAASRDLEVNNAIVVGDATAVELVSYTRFDGQQIDANNRVASPITVYGEEGESVTVRIGDLHDPNLPLLYGYYFNYAYDGEVEDETGRTTLLSNAVTSAYGTRIGGGRHLSFSQGEQNSRLWTDNLSDIASKTDQLGFSIEVKPTELRSSEVFNLGQGAYSLSLNASNVPTLTVRTEEGEFQVSGSAIQQNQWTRIAGRYQNNRLVLSIEGTQYSAAASGALHYQWTNHTNAANLEDPNANHDFTVGSNYAGQLNSFRWYDYSAEPLLTFADGTTEQSITIPEGATEQAVNLISAGNLGWNGAATRTQKVSVYSDNVSQYASLISTDAFRTLLAQQMATNPDSSPPILTANLYSDAEAGYLVSTSQLILEPVQAGWFTSFLWEAVNWVVPLEAFGEVAMQLGYLATNDPHFSPLALAGALVESLTVLPPAKGIKFITKPLRATLKLLPAKAAKPLGGAMLKIIEKAKNGNFDTLWNLMPFMVMIAQVGADPEASKGLILLLESATSAEDILAYIDFFALPADGWEGDDAPPQVDAFSGVEEVEDDELGALWGTENLQPVYAAKKNLVKKIPVDKVKKILTSMARELDADELAELPAALRTFVKEIREKGVTAEARRLVSNPKVLTTTAVLHLRAGERALKSVLTGKSNMRFSPATMFGMIAYIEWELQCGNAIDGIEGNADELGCDGKGIVGDHNRSAVNTLYTLAFLDVAKGSFKEEEHDDAPFTYSTTTGRGHGALFHLSQVAYYQMQRRFANGDPIKEIEGSRWVYFYQTPKQRDRIKQNDSSSKDELNGETPYSYNRRVDLILDVQGKEQWIELKSYSGDNKDSRRHLTKYAGNSISPWTIVKKDKEAGKSGLHKQFTIDRAAATVGHAWRPIEGDSTEYTRVDLQTDFKWRFQKFSPRKKNSSNRGMGYSLDVKSTKQKSIRNIFKTPLEPVSGFPSMVNTNWGAGSVVAGSYIEEANIATLLNDLITNGFGDAADALAEEYVE